MRSTLPVLSGKILSKKAVTQLGSGYVRNPVGTGPYEFTQWIPKQKVVLTRFAGYGKANSAYAPPAGRPRRSSSRRSPTTAPRRPRCSPATSTSPRSRPPTSSC